MDMIKLKVVYDEVRSEFQRENQKASTEKETKRLEAKELNQANQRLETIRKYEGERKQRENEAEIERLLGKESLNYVDQWRLAEFHGRHRAAGPSSLRR